MKRTAKPAHGPSALSLIEEAVHLVCDVPATAWIIYLAGAVPWVLGLGYFWAVASWMSPRPEQLLWQAFGLVGLYLGLKVAQAEFCARLRARRMGAKPPRLSWLRLRRTLLRQAEWQGWAVPVLPVAGALALPAVPAWLAFENMTALAGTDDPAGDSLRSRALREARRWPGPAHLAVLLLAGLWLCVWINVATAFFAVPWLARVLLGLDNLFGLSGWWALNSTFLALVTIITWLAVDPLVKAFHVLRTFYGEACRTGEDLRQEFQFKSPRSRGRVGAILLLVIGLGGIMPAGPTALRAESAQPQLSEQQVDAALDEVLTRRDFRWQLQPVPVVNDSEETGLVKGFVREGFSWGKRVMLDIRDLFSSLKHWFDGLTKHKEVKEKAAVQRTSTPLDFAALARVALYGLLVVALGALVWIVCTGWRQRRPVVRSLEAMGAASLPPDLNDEQLEASRLPTNEWLDLVRDQMARGEWRLALRALYLATLAGMNTRGWIVLARSKTNLDYERELQRRVPGRAEVLRTFRERRLCFESVWYGRLHAEEALVRVWLSELEKTEEQP